MKMLTGPFYIYCMENTPLFDPSTRALMRDPSSNEIERADMKAELISILRTTTDPEEAKEAMAALEVLWDADCTPNSVRASIKESLPTATGLASLKSVLTFDPLYDRIPPAGMRKAVVVVSHDVDQEDISLVAINAPDPLPEGFVPVLSSRGCTIMSPVSFLEDHEWQ